MAIIFWKVGGYRWIYSLVGHLAKYNKENRALEILDEIQDLLKSKALIKTVDNNPPIGDLVYNLKEQIEIIPLSNNIVYEMPKE